MPDSLYDFKLLRTNGFGASKFQPSRCIAKGLVPTIDKAWGQSTGQEMEAWPEHTLLSHFCWEDWEAVSWLGSTQQNPCLNCSTLLGLQSLTLYKHTWRTQSQTLQCTSECQPGDYRTLFPGPQLKGGTTTHIDCLPASYQSSSDLSSWRKREIRSLITPSSQRESVFNWPCH